jgi:hypothetical protein
MFKLQAFLRDGDQHIRRYGDPDLRLHRVLAGAKEHLDAQVLLDPFEEQLDLPSLTVEVGNHVWLQGEVVGQKHQAFPLVVLGHHTAHRTCGVERRCHANASYGASIVNSGWPGGIRHSQANSGAGLWHHQIGAGVQTVLAARVTQSHRRMESCLPGLECQAHGGTTSKSCIERAQYRAKDQNPWKSSPKCLFFEKIRNQSHPCAIKSDRLLDSDDVLPQPFLPMITAIRPLNALAESN